MIFTNYAQKTDIVTEELRSTNKKELKLDFGEVKTTESSLKDINSVHFPTKTPPARFIKPIRNTSKEPQPQPRKKISLDLKSPLHLQNVVFRMMRVQKLKVSLRKKNNASLPLLLFDRNQPMMEFTFKYD